MYKPGHYKTVLLNIFLRLFRKVSIEFQEILNVIVNLAASLSIVDDIPPLQFSVILFAVIEGPRTTPTTRTATKLQCNNDVPVLLGVL